MKSGRSLISLKFFSVGANIKTYLQTNFGQHLLKEQDLIDKIIDAANNTYLPETPKTACEIGAGYGALTLPLLESGWNLTALDKEKDALSFLQKIEASGKYQDRFKLLEQDVIQWEPTTPYSLCIGNLPYNISSEFILWYCRYHKFFKVGVFTFQKEFAERLWTQSPHSNYGRISCKVQLFYTIEPYLLLPARAFDPPPKVDSYCIIMRSKDFNFNDSQEELEFDKFSSFFFQNKRKMLRKMIWKGNSLLPVFEEFGIDSTCRPQEIPPEMVLKIFRKTRINVG